MKLNFGEKLSELRKDKGLSVIELSKEIGFSKSVIYFWENGQREPTANAILVISRFFNVSTDYLLGLEDELGSKIEKVVKKNSPEDFTPEEIEMIKGIRELNFTDQNALKVVINSFLSKNSIAKEKIKQ